MRPSGFAGRSWRLIGAAGVAEDPEARNALVNTQERNPLMAVSRSVWNHDPTCGQLSLLSLLALFQLFPHRKGSLLSCDFATCDARALRKDRMAEYKKYLPTSTVGPAFKATFMIRLLPDKDISGRKIFTFFGSKAALDEG